MKKFYQKAFLLLIALLFFFTASPSVGFSSYAAAKESYLTVDEAMEWLDSTVGTKRGDGQCIAFIKDYYQVLTGYTPRGNACEYSRNTLPEGFGWKRIKGEKRLKKGDILIWTGGTGGNGHAAIYGGDGKYYHQKWSGMYVEIVGKSYIEGIRIRRSGSFAYYWGVIRPTFRSEGQDANSNYRLRNTGTGKHLTDKGSSETTVRHFKELDLKTLLFTLDEAEKDSAVSTRSSANTVGTVPEKKKASRNKKSESSADSGRDTCKWKIQKVSDAYVIRNVNDPALCLASDRKTGKLSVEEYKGYKHQKWGTQASAAEALSAKAQPASSPAR